MENFESYLSQLSSQISRFTRHLVDGGVQSFLVLPSMGVVHVFAQQVLKEGNAGK